MPEITVTSGAKVAINVGEFEDSIRLKMVVQKQLIKNNSDLSAIDLESDITKLIGLFLAVDASPEVYAALWPCLARCTYNSERITKATFESVTARKDYYDIVVECLKVNIGPFFESLLSKFMAFQSKTAEKENHA